MAMALMQTPENTILPRRRRFQDRELRIPRHIGRPRNPRVMVHQLLLCSQYFLSRRTVRQQQQQQQQQRIIRIITGDDHPRREIVGEAIFRAGDTSSSIVKADEEESEKNIVSGGVGLLPFKESVALALESDDPYSDFKRSMAEMVESHGLKEWDCLEELLGWYLRMNGKNNHGFIVGAFVDLLVGMVDDHHHMNFSSSSSRGSSMAVCCTDSTTSYSSADSCFSSPSSPPLSPTLVVVGRDQLGIDEDRNVISQS
ncbi:hypothetical protein DH2020_010492 [Rehmannia glutinosa]|uniref:Transcription repressor n=1 Tax=Rehmannia glutinosa TaxID=99300 RepID=A0ABR0XAR7_REHGL